LPVATYWEYAKVISGSAVGDRKKYGFVMHIYNGLKNKRVSPSSILRENQKLIKEVSNLCAYCGCSEVEILQWEHIIPKSNGCLDTIDNMVLCCKRCNTAKSDKDLFQWYGKERQYEIPRIVLGKYLKLVYDAHEKNNTLDSPGINGDGLIDIFDLGHIFKKISKITETTILSTSFS
jgi:hypothetical protein